MDPSTETLPEFLKQHGYLTAAFTGFREKVEKLRPLIASRPLQAFGHYSNRMRFKFPSQELFDWLQAHRDQPFFVFLHGFDAHDPHLLPIQFDAKRFNPSYRGRLPSFKSEYDVLMGALLDEVNRLPLPERVRRYTEVRQQWLGSQDGMMRREDLDHLKALYDAQLYYLDEGLAQLFVALKNLDLMDRTLVVIISDHGQSFGEHGEYAEHGQCYTEVTRMVLIVRDPRLDRRGTTVRQLVEGIDVMPTILDLLDLPVPASVQGRSLGALLRTGRDPEHEEIAISMGGGVQAIRTPQWTLMSTAGVPTELYRITSDPKEQRNLLSRYPEVATQLQHRLDQTVSIEPIGSTIEPEQWIRKHGYW